MKRKMFLSVLVVLVLTLSLVPTSAFAAGVECPAGEACTDHTAAIGDVHYDSLKEAIAAANDGEKIVLLKSVTENSVTFSKPGTYTLDLNGNTLTSDKPGSDIIGLHTADLTLTIENGTLATEDPTTYGIYAYHKGGTEGYDNLNLKLEKVIINSIDQPLGVQGLNANQNVTVKDSVITCQTTGIYFPPYSGVLTIDNSQITALDNAVVVKGGTVIVKGEKTLLKATGVPEEQDKPYDGNTAGKGFPQTGSALYVEGGYKAAGNAGERPIDVVLQDGVFQSEHAAAVAVNYIADPQVQTTQVQGGVYSSDVLQFVSAQSVSATVTSASGDKLYYIGDTAAVSARISNAAVSGDSIEVLSGDVELTINKDDVTVVNSGSGKVVADGHEVGTDPYETHAHVLEIVGAKEATCIQEGYTGDKMCTICSQVMEKGQVLPKLAHNYQDGKCTVCGAEDPNYQPDDSQSPSTGDGSQLALWMVLLFISGSGAFVANALTRKKNG